MNGERGFLRHALATLAYRGGKTMRDVPTDFASFRTNEGTRTPIEILSHIGDLMVWALMLARGESNWTDHAPQAWDQEVDRFFASLQRLDEHLASEAPLAEPAEKLFQGPIADAFTHVGQLGMLRRMAGAQVRGENYFVADITAGQVGPDQPAPRREFD